MLLIAERWREADSVIMNERAKKHQPFGLFWLKTIFLKLELLSYKGKDRTTIQRVNDNLNARRYTTEHSMIWFWKNKDININCLPLHQAFFCLSSQHLHGIHLKVHEHLHPENNSKMSLNFKGYKIWKKNKVEWEELTVRLEQKIETGCPINFWNAS